ncbi:MAG: Zn-ribbon domain-containing OB-fold protein [Hyphomicrobiaceae bacterium]
MSDAIRNVTHVDPTLDTQGWWDALSRDEVTMPTCALCDARFFPPQAHCPTCGSADWRCQQTDGVGRLYSWVVIHRAFSPEVADKVPYAIVAVDLDDGGRIVGRFLHDPVGLHDGMALKAQVFRENGDPLLGFKSQT